MPGGRKPGPIAPGQNPGGRPEAEIDLKELEKLCAIQCTNAEIAAWFGVSERTIDRKRHEPEFLAVMERGKGKGRISVRRMQMKAAETGNPALLIWLGKQLLGQRDNLELSGPDKAPIEHSFTISDARVALAASDLAIAVAVQHSGDGAEVEQGSVCHGPSSAPAL